VVWGRWFQNGSGHDYASNQFLPGLVTPQGNLGGDGNGGFTGTLGGDDFNNFAGQQFFTIVVPEPSTAVMLFGFAALPLARRRCRSPLLAK